LTGAAALIVGFGLAMYLAYGRWSHRPRGMTWLIWLAVGFYVVCAVATALAGGRYVLAALAASLVPVTAAALLVATTRAKTVGRDDDRRDTTGAAHADPFPGVGMDEATPLGDTDQHSDAAA
jgi:predicted membrane-bound dolichyl-phosphate-mannose-protein mannosyltransferase